LIANVKKERLLPVLMLLAVVAGCHESATEVVVVLQSDLVVPTDFDGTRFDMNAGAVAPSGQPGSFTTLTGVAEPFPLSIAFLPQETTETFPVATASFSLRVQLQRGVVAGPPLETVVTRAITDIRFVDEQRMMVVVPLLRACACTGTSCPNPGNPDCDDIKSPTLQPWDPAVSPPSSRRSLPRFMQL